MSLAGMPFQQLSPTSSKSYREGGAWTRRMTSSDAIQEMVQRFGVGFVGHTGALRSKSTLTAIKWPRIECPGSVAFVASVYWVGTELAVERGPAVRAEPGGGPTVSNLLMQILNYLPGKCVASMGVKVRHHSAVFKISLNNYIGRLLKKHGTVEAKLAKSPMYLG